MSIKAWVIVVLSLHGCAAGIQPEPAQGESATSTMMSVARQTANRLLVTVTGSTLVEIWTDPRVVAEGTPLYRPDLPNVAFVEFAVEPSGYVMVSTGAHDQPIVAWSEIDEPITTRLAAKAAAAQRRAAKFYRLAPFAFAAEDAEQALVAGLDMNGLRGPEAVGGSNTTSRSWTARKAAYATTARLHNAAVRDAAAQARSEANIAAGQPGGATSILDEKTIGSATAALSDCFGDWDCSWAGGWPDQPRYSQWFVEDAGCYSGCGPTAWAILFGWIDRQAHAGGDWASYTNIIPWMTAPLWMENSIKPIILSIRNAIDTTCVHDDQGYTEIARMQQAQNYLDGVGLASLEIHDEYNILAIPESRIRDFAIETIQTYERPVVVGYWCGDSTSEGGGWLSPCSHYAVAYAYRWDDDGNREFKLNLGNGGYAWLPASIFYAGRVER
jgi:hypothetical protein